KHSLATAFRWTQEEGMQSLGTLNGGLSSEATGVSADGAVIVGCMYNDATLNHGKAFRWTQNEGMQFLGSLNEGKRSWATGVSADGSVIVGYAAEDAKGNQTIAFRWTQNEGMQSLGTLEGGESYAQGVSFNGSVIVGKSVNDDPYMAFRWTREKGMESVGELLIEQGLLHPEGMLTEINAITPNGVVLVGKGEWEGQVENEENAGQIRAWRAIIPRGNLF